MLSQNTVTAIVSRYTPLISNTPTQRKAKMTGMESVVRLSNEIRCAGDELCVIRGIDKNDVGPFPDRSIEGVQ